MLSRFLEEMGSVGKREARDLRPVFVRDSDELNRVWFPYTVQGSVLMFEV